MGVTANSHIFIPKYAILIIQYDLNINLMSYYKKISRKFIYFFSAIPSRILCTLNHRTSILSKFPLPHMMFLYQNVLLLFDIYYPDNKTSSYPLAHLSLISVYL